MVLDGSSSLQPSGAVKRKVLGDSIFAQQLDYNIQGKSSAPWRVVTVEPGQYVAEARGSQMQKLLV